jgi:hypothetical protein
MKVFSKILILIIAVTLAVGGVMIYAKTKVEPPKATPQTNQYLDNLSKSYASFGKTHNADQEDSIFADTWSRISIFVHESKISKTDADKGMDLLVGKYSPLFLNRAFSFFKQNVWYEKDHQYIKNVINTLMQIKHSDGTLALSKTTQDSIAQVEGIITRYYKARAISHYSRFAGVANAQSIISQARQYANDPWLSHCTDLVSSLNNVRSSIGQSHYNHIVAMVEKLAQYRSMNQSYYENTLVPQVDAAVTEYDNKAAALYGSKRDVNVLWNRAKSYYNDASLYYN